MCKLFRKIADSFKWIYDTSMPTKECISILTGLPETTPHSMYRFNSTKLSESQIEMIFRQSLNGEGSPRRSRYIADFYDIENGQTVIVVRFQENWISPIPSDAPRETDRLFENTIYAKRRK